ncbi:MAG: zinc ribbon domain-containing protein [Myxococcales bacterium]|nr:zinc ribbon domain-containing protein [Myxococcales bacterium]
MLIACPECAHEVSDRAVACPKCGFPIAEQVAQQQAAARAEAERSSRALTDAKTDCQPCEGRGFRMFQWTDDDGREASGFTWCERCHETGQLPVVRSDGGFFAVAVDHVEAFVAGTLGPDSPHVTALGAEPPPPPSYPPPGRTDDSTS